MCGCGAREAKRGPSVEFSKVPPGERGGPGKVDTIEGRVSRARSGQRIVLFARSGGQWWVQPFADRPFTEIHSDSTWTNSTHLGTEYAALLVEPSYHPSLIMLSLPPPGGGVLVVASVKGGPSPPQVYKTIDFSGYEWRVSASAGDRGGRINDYDPANAWTDKAGALHLRIAKQADRWTCAEVTLTRSLGYGSYRFVVGDSSHLSPAVALDLYTWDDLHAEQNHKELVIGISRGGRPFDKNAEYVVQPYYVATNVMRFLIPSGTLVHSFRWEPGKLSFQTVREAGGTAPSHGVAGHVFTSGVPTEGGELIHLNFYLLGREPNPIPNPTEVVIEKFEYLP
jgi:hypothetical protein